MSETTRADNRSTDGCRTCRTRRVCDCQHVRPGSRFSQVKCDGQKPICSVCKTARVPCKWHREGERSVSPLSLDRARIKLACSTCRSRKVCMLVTASRCCELTIRSSALDRLLQVHASGVSPRNSIHSASGARRQTEASLRAYSKLRRSRR